MVVTKNSPPEEILHQHIIDSCKKLKENVEATTQEAVESIDKLNLKDEVDLTALISESNAFVHEINNIVDELRILVLHVKIETTAKQDLLAITLKLAEIAYSVSSSYNDEPSKLQSALKTAVQGVSAEVDNLFKLIETGALKKRRQDYVDALNELVSAVYRVRVRNEIIHLSPEEVAKFLLKSCEKAGVTVAKLTSKNDYNHLVGAFIHYDHVANQNSRKLINYLFKHGRHYDEHIAKGFLHCSQEIHNMYNRLHEIYSNSQCSVDDLLSAITTNLGTGFELILQLPLHLKRNDTEDIESIKETVYNICCETIVIVDQLERGFRTVSCLN